jgi:hypothetical protein
MPDVPPLIVIPLHRDELAQLVRESVREALATEARSPSPPATPRLTLDALAHAESVSRATIRRLMREPGAPVHHVGNSPRFDLAEWRAWSAERGRRAAATATSTPPPSPKVGQVCLLSRGGAR